MLINVQLPNTTEITQMDDSLLVKSVGTDENEDAWADWVEYRLDGVIVHRSVHVRLKRIPTITLETGVIQ